MNFIFEQCENIKIPSFDMEFWKMNILALSPKHNLLLLAVQNNIYAFNLQNDGKIRDHETPKVYQVHQDDYIINQICVKYFQDKHYLMCVDMKARVTIFELNNMDHSLYEFDNTYQEIEDNSTWSLDVFVDSQKTFVACGANNKKISMWDISNAGHPSQRMTIDAHDHNIPCVKFSPCGEFIASTSIDRKVKIFSVKTGQEICFYDLSNWGWSVTWIPKNSVLNSGKYKLEKLIKKEANPENPKFVKGTINYKLNKYLLFVSEASKMKLLDPMNSYKEEIVEEKIFEMKEIHSETKFLTDYTRISIVKHCPLFSLIIAVCTHSPIVFFREIYFKEDTFTFDSLKTEFNFPGLILGMDAQEIKGATVDLDICRIYFVCKEKIVSQVEISKDYKFSYSLKDSFL